MNKIILEYNERKFVLVCRKSDFEANNIGNGYFLVPEDEWLMPDDSISLFCLHITEFKDNQICAFFDANNKMVVNQALPLSRRSDYTEISFN